MTLGVEGLVKRFDRHAPPVLDGVSFSVPEGSLTCLVGASGAGKSTVLGIVAGLVAPDAGRVSVGGRPIDGLPPHRRPVTLLMQQAQLFPHLSVIDNVAFGLRVRGVGRAARQRRAAELLELVGTGALADRSPRRLSGGEQQRVALARALAVRPQVLLADEPFASVDAPVRRELQALTSDLHRQLGTTIVLVTHDVAESLALADQLVVVHGGRVVDRGAPQQLYERPGSRHSARLLGFANELAGTLDGGRLHVGGVSLAVGADDARGSRRGPRPSTWVIRPERVRVCPEWAPGSLRGTVSSLRYQGSAIEATIEVGGLTVVAHLAPSDGPALGDSISVGLAAEHLVEVDP